MPSKTLLRSAETLAEAKRAHELAASRVEWQVDFPKIAKRTHWLVRDLDDSTAAKGLEETGARLIRGQAVLTGRRTVEVGGRRLEARKAIVIASGTEPAVPPIAGLISPVSELIPLRYRRRASSPKEDGSCAYVS